LELRHKASDIGYLLSDKSALPATFRYIAVTRRFEKTHGNLAMETEQDKEQDKEDGTKD
jgi:hypothetical protein